MSDSVKKGRESGVVCQAGERGRGCEAVGRAVVGLARILYLFHFPNSRMGQRVLKKLFQTIYIYKSQIPRTGSLTHSSLFLGNNKTYELESSLVVPFML